MCNAKQGDDRREELVLFAISKRRDGLLGNHRKKQRSFQPKCVVDEGERITFKAVQ